MSATQPATATNNDNQNVKPKGKQKKKGEKLNIDQFIGKPNWNTIMENDTENDDVIIPTNYTLPEGPKALQQNDIDLSLVPTEPPYRTVVRNLYELEKEDLENHFRNLHIVDIQIVKDMRNYRQAHIDFETRKDLINAMNMKNKPIKGRMISMSLFNDRASSGGGGGGDRRGRSGGFGRDNTPSDWRSSIPPKQMYPPPSLDQYDAPQRSYRNTRGPEDDGQWARGDGHYESPYEDRSGGYRGHRMNDYGGGGGRIGNDGGRGRSGNWNRDNDRMPSGSNEPELENWRRGPPAQQDPYESRRIPPRAMPQSRMNDTYSNDDDYRHSQPQVIERRHDMHDRRYDYDTRRGAGNDYEPRLGHRNPPLMDHPQRERLSSVRSNVSAGDQQQPVPHSLMDEYDRQPVIGTGSNTNVSPPQIPSSSSTQKHFINESVLGVLAKIGQVSESGPANSTYSKIFGEAKPVDTSKREMEIEKKIQTSIQDIVAQQPPPPQSSMREDSSGPVSGQPTRDYHQDSIPPRHARRTNGSIGVSGGGHRGPMPRRDHDYDRNGALGGDRRGPRGPRDGVGGGRNMRQDRRGDGGGYRGDYYNDDRRRGYDRDRIGSGRRYGDDIGGSGSRYGGGGYDNDRNRYNDYLDGKDDLSKTVNYTSTNKFDHLGEAEDHGLE